MNENFKSGFVAIIGLERRSALQGTADAIFPILQNRMMHTEVNILSL